jgi:hypothetical protein
MPRVLHQDLAAHRIGLFKAARLIVLDRFGEQRLKCWRGAQFLVFRRWRRLFGCALLGSTKLSAKTYSC